MKREDKTSSDKVGPSEQHSNCQEGARQQQHAPSIVEAPRGHLTPVCGPSSFLPTHAVQAGMQCISFSTLPGFFPPPKVPDCRCCRGPAWLLEPGVLTIMMGTKLRAKTTRHRHKHEAREIPPPGPRSPRTCIIYYNR